MSAAISWVQGERAYLEFAGVQPHRKDHRLPVGGRLPSSTEPVRVLVTVCDGVQDRSVIREVGPDGSGTPGEVETRRFAAFRCRIPAAHDARGAEPCLYSAEVANVRLRSVARHDRCRDRQCNQNYYCGDDPKGAFASGAWRLPAWACRPPSSRWYDECGDVHAESIIDPLIDRTNTTSAASTRFFDDLVPGERVHDTAALFAFRDLGRLLGTGLLDVVTWRSIRRRGTSNTSWSGR